MIRVAGISVTLGPRQPLRGVDFDAEAGQVTGIIGPNGSGKTTLLRVLAGVQPPSAGQVLLKDTPLSTFSPAARARRLAYLPQNGTVAWPLRVREVAALGRLPLSPAPLDRPTAEDRTAIARALDRAACTSLADRPFPDLSGGEKARALLARALATEAPILLADEPVAALDPAHQVKILTSLRAEATRGGCVVLVLHDLSLAARFCDRLALLTDGTLAAAGPTAAVLTAPLLEAAFGTGFHRDFTGPVPVLVPTHALPYAKENPDAG